MADSKPEPFYNPDGENGQSSPVEPVKRRGRPSRVLDAAVAAAAPSPPTPPLAAPPPAAQAVAIGDDDGVTADATISPTAMPEAEETLEQAIARIRALRKPFGTALALKLALPARTGYHHHWFNDVAGRIDEAKASGWSHLKDQGTGAPVRRVVGTGRDGKPLYAYAMELPDVFWQEHMAAIHQQAKEKIDAIKAKPFRAQQGQAQASDQGKFYNPVEESGAGPLQVVSPKA